MKIRHLLESNPFLKKHVKAHLLSVYGWLNSIKQKRLSRQIANAAKTKKRPIKVAFLLYELPFWKNEALFKAMQEDERFTPAFWILNPPYIADATIRNAVRKQCDEYVNKNNFLHYDDLTLVELRKSFSPAAI